MSETRTEKQIIDEAYSDEAAKTWRAPVQGYQQGIPWAIHLEAYDAYVKRWSKQTALIDLKGRNCRGGFHVDELDTLVPGWRDRVSYVAKLEARIAEFEAMTGDHSIDCRSEVGVTIGLIDMMITAARVLASRDLSDANVIEALKDIRSDEDVRVVLTPSPTHISVESDWRALLHNLVEWDGGEGSKGYHASKLYDARQAALSALAQPHAEVINA